MHTYSATTTIKYPVSRCWSAWTSTNQLPHWIGAGNIDLETELHLASQLPYLSGRHPIRSYQSEKSLEFDWSIDGYPAIARVLFQQVGDLTEITVELEVDPTNAPAHIEPLAYPDHYFYFIGQSWDHALLNLKCYLEDQQDGVVIERANNDHVINLRVDIDAPAEKIFHALTDTETLCKWNSGLALDTAKVVAEEGGTYTYGWYPEGTPEDEIDDGPQRILTIKTNELLEIDWFGGAQKSSVTWRLEAKEDGSTRIHFKHATLLGHSHGSIWSYRSGWTSSLYALKWFLERGELEPDWFRRPEPATPAPA